MSEITDALSTINGGDDGIEGECSVRVYVRIRPLNKKELAEKQVIEWRYNKTAIFEDTQNGQRQYAYDACFGIDSTNDWTYKVVGKPVVIKAMEGYNGTVFTYGQTGSGKTWTMRGSQSDPGMMILCLDDIFDFIKANAAEKTYALKVSYMEVYNEEINDLLFEIDSNLSKEDREKEEEKHKKLRIATEDAARGAVIENLCEIPIKSKEEALRVLERGEMNRSYASTSMNDNSSRSHVIYRIAITIFDNDGGNNIDADEDEFPRSFRKAFDEDLGRVSYMNLVDLAGSERQKSTNASGKTLKEGANINKSLLALGAVINKLGEASKKTKSQKEKVFIPYRDSKLTRILKQSLGGNTLTSILCTISPAPMYREETVSTLKFGQLCKLIKNQVQSNVIHDDKAEMRRLRSLISELKAKVEELEARGGGGFDNRVELQRLSRDKKKLESLVEALQEALKSSGIDPSLVQSTYVESTEDTLLDDPHGSGGGGVGGANSEQVNEFKHKIKSLESRLSEYKDIEEEREDLELRKRDMEKEREKMDGERKKLTTQKNDNLVSNCAILEKEEKAQLLIRKLETMDSRLQKKLHDLNEQEQRWAASIADLKKKEDLVLEWEQHHADRESQLEKDLADLEAKTRAFSGRKLELSKEEQKFKNDMKELEERGWSLQVTLSKIGQRETEIATAEERLQSAESELKGREADISFREREIQSKRREVEIWDASMADKDRSISAKQRAMEEKEAVLREKDEKLNHSKLQLEKKLFELRHAENQLVAKTEELTNHMKQQQVLEVEMASRNSALNDRDRALVEKEDQLHEREEQIQVLQSKMSGIERREGELQDRIEEQRRAEERHHNDVGLISSKHRREVSELEALASQQLKIIANYQVNLERSKSEIATQVAKNAEYEIMIRQRDNKEEQLRAELMEKTAGMGGLNSAVNIFSVAASGGDESFSARSQYGSAPEDSEEEAGLYSSQSVNLYSRQTQQSGDTDKGLMRRLAESQSALFRILEANRASPQVETQLHTHDEIQDSF